MLNVIFNCIVTQHEQNITKRLRIKYERPGSNRHFYMEIYNSKEIALQVETLLSWEIR